MVEILRGWLLGLVAAALILTVLRALMPKGSIRPVARVTAGLVLLLVLLRPLAGLGGGSLRIKDIVIQETDYTAPQIKIMEAN